MNMELDCASTMFVLGRNENRKYIIRLSVTLAEGIEKEYLQIALLKSIQNYPYFFVRFITWQNILFAQPIDDIPFVREKENIANLNIENTDGCEAQVTYFNRTIILEYSHAVSDGKGGLEFLICLTAEYLSLKYHDDAVMRNIPAIPVHAQMENSYQVHSHGFRTEKTRGSAYKIKDVSDISFMGICSYCLPTDEMKRRAKRHWVSVTEYVAALLSITLCNIRNEMDAGSREKIRLSVPVNLRQFFQSHTMRNFSLNVYPEFDPEEDDRELSHICIKFHQYMKRATAPLQLAGRCSSSTKVCDFMKRFPVSVKKRIVQSVLDASPTGSSLTFSNIGIVGLPERMKDYVTDIGMLFSVKPEAPYSCSVITVNKNMKITFLRALKEPLLESAFEKVLHELGIFYVKESNEAGGQFQWMNFLDKYIFPYTEKYIGRAKKTKDGLIAYSEREEKFNMVSHAAGIFIGLGMLIVSIFFHHTELGMTGGIIFGVSLIILYLSSSIYHGMPIKNVKEKKILRIMDHCSIFVLVAGTCTPFILSMIEQKAVDLEWCFYAFIWALALAGITLLCVNMKKYKSVTVVMYVLMGIILVARADTLFGIIGENGIWMLLAGGVLYLIGLLFYGLGSRKEWMHSVFHVLCLAGSVIHCVCVGGYII